ncbi:MAG: GreA/GreB family elongation factor, partial [Bacteroidales bacterium]|nr:GreA/GreB family elongation factor [Bacteroidales bacterium]
MSRGFVKEGDQEEVPMVLPRAFLPKNVPNYVTEEGLKLLQEEMLALKRERASAGSNYVHKNYIDAKINLLSERLNSAVLLDVKNRKGDADVVSFGSYVKFNDKVVRIVGVDEADASKGLISFVSPIAKALIGKKKGDRVEVKLPKGTETIEIQDVMISCELRAMSREPEVRKTNLPVKEVQSSAISIQPSAISVQSSQQIAQCSQLNAQSQSPEFKVQGSKFKP